MRIATEIASAAKLVGEEKAIELIARAGFDAWDFSMCSMFKYDKVNDCLFDSDHPLRSSRCLAFSRRLKQVGLETVLSVISRTRPFPSRENRFEIG